LRWLEAAITLEEQAILFDGLDWIFRNDYDPDYPTATLPDVGNNDLDDWVPF